MFRGIELHRARAPNLMRVVVAADPRMHTAVAMWMVRAGSRDEPEEKAGLSHLLEHLKFRGTQRYPYEDGVLAHLRSFGGGHNGYTTRETTAYFIQLQPQHLRRATDLLGDMAATYRFNGLEIERRVVLEEIEETLDAGKHPWDLWDVAMVGLWPDHRIGPPVIGSTRTVLGITPEDLERYLATHYSADNSVLVVAGPVNPRAVMDLAEEHFAHLKRAPVPARVPAPAPAKGTLVRLESNVRTQGKLVFGFRFDTDRETTAVALLARLLGDRLHDGLRGRKGVTYTSWATSHRHSDFGLLACGVQVSGGKLPMAAVEWGTHIAHLRDTGPAADEVERAKEALKTEFLHQLNDPYELCNTLALEAHDPLGTSLEDSLMVLESITPAEVRAIAQRLIRVEQAHLIIRGTGYPAEFEGAWAQVRKLLG